MTASVHRQTAFARKGTGAVNALSLPPPPPSPSVGQGSWTEFAVETSHGRIAGRSSGNRGVPVLLLHGNSASKDVFRHQMDFGLAGDCRMIAIDLPGHGASADAADPTRTYSIAGYADAVIEVVERLGLDHLVLVGWSLGGHVALEIASRFPGVLGVMICGTPPIGTSLEAIVAGYGSHPDLALLGRETLTPAERDALARLVGQDADEGSLDAAIARTDGRARSQMYANLFAGAFTDERAFVATSTMPIAVVNGADDAVINAGYVRHLDYASLWYGRCHVVPNGGHAPFLTQPKLFNRVFKRFLKSMRLRHRTQIANPDLCFSA